jgi:hypothetical protein
MEALLESTRIESALFALPELEARIEAAVESAVLEGAYHDLFVVEVLCTRGESIRASDTEFVSGTRPRLMPLTRIRNEPDKAGRY